MRSSCHDRDTEHKQTLFNYLRVWMKSKWIATEAILSGTNRRRGSLVNWWLLLSPRGFGLFHWLLLLVCGWANASDAVEILCVSFLLPTARCDLLLSSSDMGLLTASIFLGASKLLKQTVVLQISGFACNSVYVLYVFNVLFSNLCCKCNVLYGWVWAYYCYCWTLLVL